MAFQIQMTALRPSPTKLETGDKEALIAQSQINKYLKRTKQQPEDSYPYEGLTASINRKI